MEIESNSNSSQGSLGAQLKRLDHQKSQALFLEYHSNSINSRNSDMREFLSGSEGKDRKGQEEDAMSIQQKPQGNKPFYPDTHNCVCLVVGDCLGINCNCFLSPLPCAPGCCQTCIILKNSVPKDTSRPCACKKSKCLKLYCQCLSNMKFCTARCHCEFCQNHNHSKERKIAVQELIERDPDSFASKNQSAKLKSCKCRRTKCDKKYCLCFSEGVSCNEWCKCQQCLNGKPIIQRPKIMQRPNWQPEKVVRKLQFQFEAMDFG